MTLPSLLSAYTNTDGRTAQRFRTWVVNTNRRIALQQQTSTNHDPILLAITFQLILPLSSLFSGVSWMIPWGTNTGHPLSAPPEVKAACLKPTSGQWQKCEINNSTIFIAVTWYVDILKYWQLSCNTNQKESYGMETKIFIMDSGVLVYGDVTFDTVGCVHSEWRKSNTVNPLRPCLG